MRIPVRRSCLSLIVLSALVDVIRSNENETSTAAGRKSRGSQRIVKQYSGYKPDPPLCSEEGFKADPIHCTIFYRCVKSSSGKFTVFKFQCGPGTVYDPETEVCNHPSSTKRSECGGVAPNFEHENEIVQELPSPISTLLPVYGSQKIPALNNTDVFTSSTEKVYTYSPTTSTTHSITSSTNRVQEINHNLEGYPWLHNKKTTQSTIATSTTIFPNSDRKEQCTSDGFMGDSVNCKKFYRCISNSRGGFIRYEFLCSEPTVWDDQMQSCNYPWAMQNRRCGRGSVYNKNDTQTLDLSYNNNISTGQSGTSYGDNLSDVSKHNEKDRINKKEPTNNYENKLINVENGIKNVNNEYPSYQSTAPNNILPETNRHTEIVHHNYDEKTTVKSTYSTNKIENNNSQLPSINRKIGCTQSGFFGDSEDCRKFYRCVDDGKGSFLKHEFSCSQGTVWDKKLETCNYAWAVKECGGLSTALDLATTDLHAVTSTSSSVLDENIDNGYLNQINAEREEPATVTNNRPVSISTSTATSSIGRECTEIGFIGDTNDCKKFYRCVDNGKGAFTKFEYTCGDGTLWDQKIEACNHAWAVSSCNSSLSNNIDHTTFMEELSSSPVNNAYYTTHTNNIGNISTVSSTQTSTSQKEDTDYDSGYALQQGTTTKRPVTNFQTTTSKQPIEKNNECQSSGFLGDIYNCNKFYRCVDNGHGGFIKYEFSCGEGTVWDPEIEACNHAWAVQHCGGTLKPNENISTSSMTNLITEEPNGYITQNYIDSEATTSFTNYQTSALPLNKNNECIENGFMGDKNDCKKFYRCVDNGNGSYIRYEFSCGEGTLWDSQINSCNHAWAVKDCTHNSTETMNNIPINNSSSTISNGGITNEYTTSNNRDPGYFTESTTLRTSSSTVMLITSSSVSNECKKSGFIGDNNNCQKFYRCVDNGKGSFSIHEFLCGEGTVWDPKIEACNHKWAVEKCGNNSHSELPEATTQSQSSINPITQSTATTTFDNYSSTTILSNTKPSLDDKGCTSEGFFANTKDCKKFYRCVNEGKNRYTKYEFACVDGTVWVQEIQACDYDTDGANCSVLSSSTTISSSESSTTMSSSEISTTISSTESLITTSSLDSSTDATSAINVSIQNSSIDVNNPDKTSNNDCNSEGFFPSPYSCENFYRCVNNGDGSYTKYEFVCAEGTAWDRETQSCNYINKVQCLSNQNQPNGTNIVKPIRDDQGAESSTTKTTTLASNTKIPKPSKQNVCKEEGYYGDTKNCKKFYRCVHEDNGKYTKYDFTCGEGTIWDQDIIACNHPYDVKNPSCGPEQESTSVASTSSIDLTSESSSSITTDKPSSSTIKSTTSSTTTSESTTSNNESNVNCSSDTSTKGPNETNYTCSKAGFYADPRNCKKFYRCVDWENNGKKFSLYHFECADGTIWDPALETCNHEDSVYPARICNGTQQHNENKTEIPLTTEETASTTTSQTESSTTPSETTKTTQTPTMTTTQATTTSQLSSTQTQTTQSYTTASATTQSSTTTESTTQSTTYKEPTSSQPTTVGQSTTNELSSTDTTPHQVSTDPTTTEINQEQTTKSSTTHTTNEETTTSESSLSTTPMSTIITEQTSTTTEQSTTEQSTVTDVTLQTTNSQTTETSTSSTAENTETNTESNSASDQKCPKADENQHVYVCPTSFKRHPKYCDLFYQCTENNDSHEVKIAVFSCPNNTIYDESKIQCVEEENSNKKCKGQIAQKHRVKRLGIAHNDPFVVTKESMACQSTGYFPFEKRTECSSVFLKCSAESGKLQGQVYKCPEGFVYWNISRRCEIIKKVRGCKRSSYPWKNRNDVPEERFNIAS